MRFRLFFIYYCIQTVISLSSFIKNYDSVNYDTDSHKRFRRSAIQNNDGSYNVIFQAFKKNFHLKLNRVENIFDDNTEVYLGNNRYELDDMVPVSGKLKYKASSSIYGTMVDGVFRGVIVEDSRNISDGKWFVEHSGYYFDSDPGFHSIIYHDSHVNHRTSGCGWLNSNVSNEMYRMTLSHNKHPNLTHCKKSSKVTEDIFHGRQKRSAKSKSSQYVCNLYLQSDTFLWNKVFNLPHIRQKKHLAMKEISSIFTQHVQGAQAIYQNTVFQKIEGGGSVYHGIGFRVDRVRINTTLDCQAPHDARNPFCDANIDVTNFLNLNSYVQHDDFCLAYVFTYRDFSGGTLGLAWVAEPGGSGGVCEKHRMMQEGSVNVRKSLNTGIVTLLNYGSYVALKVSQLTFAHEMGHNFGSKHDDDHKDRSECLPLVDDPRGNFIMFASATSGDKENNNKFSQCSKDSIARLLDRVTNSKSNCFQHQEGSFCGNKLTEEGEQCDCGYSEDDCQDRCCFPKKSAKPCRLRKTTTDTFRVVQCSPTAGECCTTECQFRPEHHMCRTVGECYKAAHCQGTNTRCPASEKVPDLTKCQDNTRVCKNGECVGSICESVTGWQECSIVRSEKVTPKMMCYVACKENRTGAPCISTYDLVKNAELRSQYPDLSRELLMPLHKAIQLKPGAPCDNYHGYCDAFLRCRSVEADGPLARIKNLIFSPKMLYTIKLWITQYWWGVMLMCIGGIIVIGLFLKLCSRNTPSTVPTLPASTVTQRHGGHKNGARVRNSRHSNGRPGNNSRHINNGRSHNNCPTAPPPLLLPNGRVHHQHGGGNHGNHNMLLMSPPLPSATDQSVCPPRPPPVRPPRSHNHRPISMIQTNGPLSDVATRPISMNIESSIHIQEFYRPGEPGYPPPAYNEVSPLVMIPQHGRGKKGHRIALNQQASRYK